MMQRPWLSVILSLSLFQLGCMGCPSPLAPGLTGSVGVPHSGVLTSGEELPQEGPGYRRFRKHGEANFGVPRLVQGLTRTAQTLAIAHPGGPPLVVGDLSVRNGGKIPRHNSHRTGRDVDLLLFVQSPEGVPIESPGFVSLGADGFARLSDGRYVRLDVEREWQLVRTLLLDEELGVQFLFLSRDLEAQLIEYALARETDLSLVWHAETVMLEPADSLPHTDHIHMRIACSADDAVTGCTGGGPHWPWLPQLPELELSETEIAALSLGDDPLEDAPTVDGPLLERVASPKGTQVNLGTLSAP
jgi:penicillin-insensitive murein DD-endopeptidase